ncbi:MAG: metal-dependent transcriptional regulator [Halobacteriales archaeon]|nr:metal-dependent transcriptional regulator [Halobacteriales archaeon]
MSSGRLATFLDRSPAATTEMIQRLEAKDLVSYEPYEGASLTPSGREQAEALHETYVTLSWFFRAVLGPRDVRTRGDATWPDWSVRRSPIDSPRRSCPTDEVHERGATHLLPTSQ